MPEHLELEIEGIKGSDTSQDSLVTNPAFTVAPGFDPAIAPINEASLQRSRI